MRILLLGASGFIGSELARALANAGYQVIGLGRDPHPPTRLVTALDWIAADLRSMQREEDWASILPGVEVIINASGVLQTGLRDDVERVQLGAILALAAAAESAGVRNFIQISASNADPASPSRFMATKGEADAAIGALEIPHTILRPGLVIDRNAFGGTEMLRMAASLPGFIPAVRNTGLVQCVAMTDLVDAVLLAVESTADGNRSFDLVERQGRNLADVIACHRAWMGFPPTANRLSIPRALMAPVTLLADFLGWLGWRSPLRSNSIAALVNGVSGNADQSRKLLGREPLSLEEALAAIPAAGKADRWHGRTAAIYPLALASLFVLFALSGILGLLRPLAAIEPLETANFPREAAETLIAVGSSADLACALLLAIRRTTRLALLVMLGLSLGYVCASLVFVPRLWLDPLGPMLKVLPVIALVLLCLGMADER